MKKILALIFAFVLILGTLGVFAVSEEKYAKNMVVVGDFTSTGYGLDGYGTSVAAVLPTFSNLAAEKLGLKYCESYFNFSSDTLTLANLSDAIGEKESEQLKNADTVVISVGNADLQGVILPKIAVALGLSETATPLDVKNALTTISEDKIEGTLNALNGIYDGSKEELDSFAKSYGEKCAETAKKIKEASPNAQIFFVGTYDFLADMPNYRTVETARSALMSKVISQMNKTLVDTAKTEGFHAIEISSEFIGRSQDCIDADGTHFLLTEFGHKLLCDVVVCEINAAYDELNSGDVAPKTPKDVWLYFSVALALTLSAELPQV